jgi:RimJ/RimL family protein N-acetyltransferase
VPTGDGVSKDCDASFKDCDCRRQPSERLLYVPRFAFKKMETRRLIREVRIAYLRTLVGPLDGMWETTVIDSAAFWGIFLRDRRVGHFCLGTDRRMLRYDLIDAARMSSDAVLREIIATFAIQHAVACTLEPFYFSSCLDLQTEAVVQCYLFRDATDGRSVPDLGGLIFRKVSEDETTRLVAFYQSHIEGDTGWVRRFVLERVKRGELFGLYDDQSLLATGECIPSRLQPPYADLGVLVARPSRGKGLGTCVLMALKEHCARVGLTPICSCSAGNHASKRAILKAGFVTEHRTVKMQLAKWQATT